jgi:hypothetical protein
MSMVNKKLGKSAIRFVMVLVLAGEGVFFGSAFAGAGELSPVESLDVGTLGPSVSSKVLDRSRGGFQMNDASLSGVVSGNTVTIAPGSNLSFSNVLGGSAFQNASGIVNVIQNNGSNVLIQNMVQLNLQFRH